MLTNGTSFSPQLYSIHGGGFLYARQLSHPTETLFIVLELQSW